MDRLGDSRLSRMLQLALCQELDAVTADRVSPILQSSLATSTVRQRVTFKSVVIADCHPSLARKHVTGYI